MAREIITQVLCDPCLANDERVEGEETPPLTFGSMKPRRIALCEAHRAEFYEPLETLLREMGQMAEAPERRAPGRPKRDSEGGHECPLCLKSLKSRESLQAHCRNQHGQTLKDIEASAPEAVVEVECETVTCDQPGCDVSYSQPDNPKPRHALAVHLARTHGISAKQRREKKSA